MNLVWRTDGEACQRQRRINWCHRFDITTAR
jgi:hypothetical protein